MTTGSDPKVTGTNTSGLYGSTGQVTVGTAQYGNANVAAFLATYTGNLTAGNASVSGNITGGNILSDNYFYANGQPISFAGTYSNANVAAYLPIYSGNIAAGNGNITNDLFVGGTIYGTFSGNIAGNLVVPGANTEILYNNAGNAGASSDFRFDSATRVMLLNGTANVANIIVPQQGTIDVGNSRIQNVQTPIAGQDAVNKDYVDGTASSVGWVLEDQFNVPTGVQDGDGVQFIGTNNQIETNVVATRTLEISLANTISVAGNITGNYILGNGSQLTGLPATYGNANVATFLADFGANAISTTGNVTAGYFIGNGSLLTGLSGTYSNANVAAFLAAFGSNTISTSGNITSGNIIADGQFLTNLPGANVTGTVANATYALNANAATFAGMVTTNAQPNITSVGTLSSLSSTGNIIGGNILTPGAVSATGNITGLYIIGDGSLLTNINAGNIVGSYGNANVANFLANFGSNNITTTGNITAGYFAGNGSALTDITGANVTGTVANATYALNANAATLAGTVTTNAQPNITSVGNLTSLTVSGDSLMLGNLQVNGNVTYIASNTVTINDKFINVANNAANSSQATGGGIGVGPAGSEYATWTFSDANTAWQSNIKIEAPAVSATGNITGNYIIGDGSLLTNINAGNIVGSYSNANVANYLPTFGGNVGAGNVVLTTTTGRVYVNEIQGLSGAGLSISADGTEDINLNADTIRVGDNNTDATIATHGAGDLILRTHLGDANQGNIIIRDGAGGNIDITPNGSGVVNITGSAGLRVTDGVSAAGNITGANIIGNGQFLTNLPGANVTGTVANATYALSANSATFAGTVTTNAQPNITSVGTLTSLTSSGNVTGGNLLTGGVVSATGNITGNYFFGNGAFLTGISASVAGSNTEVQFNDAGVFGASANLTFNKATQELQTDRINLVGGNVNFDPPSGTAGPRYITLTTDSGQPFYGVRIGPGATAANIPGAARDTVAIGRNAGNDNQGDNAIAIGMAAGNLNSGAYTVAIGTAAGANTQGSSAIAIGDEAGRENQGPSAIAIGEDAGYTSQGARSIAIGPLAGNVSQGNTAIAIGYGAGQNNQPANSIVINANGTTALNATNSGFYVMPVRNDTGNTTNAVYYNTTTKELTYTTSGSGGYGDANVATFLAVYGSNTFSSTGNVTTTGVFTASNTAANLQVANIIFNNQQLQTVGARNPGAISATVADPGRIVIGTGYGGNLSPGNDLNNYFRGARLAVGDSISQADNQQRTVAVAAQQFVTATANITNNNTRMIATSGQLMLGGGSSGNTFGQTNPLTINGGAFSVLVGGGTSGNLTAMGNTITTVATGTSAGVIANPGGTIRSGINFLAFNNGSNGSGNIGNAIAFSWQTLSSTGSGNTSCFTGNVYMIYNAGSTNDFGWTQATAARSAPNYYFLRNDDNAAQNKMGAMRLWHEYRYDHTVTSGSITVDKNNGQNQYLAVTGDITSVTFSNFVVTASDGVNTDQEMDTVTLWIRQDATGRTVTLPTGAAYVYTGQTSVVPTAANSISCVRITAIDNGGSTQYLINITSSALLTLDAVTATGSITGGNLITAGLLTASNTTANLQVANLIANNQQVQTVAARDPAAITATVADPGRIVIGTGFGGNLNPGNDLNNVGRGSRLLVGDSINQAENQQRTVGLGVQQYVTATANISNINTRAFGFSGQLMVGGGPSGNTWLANNPATVTAAGSALTIGGGTSGNLTSIGNTRVLTCTGSTGFITVNAGSSANTATAILGGHVHVGNVGNAIGYSTQFTASSGSPFIGNVYAVYHPGSTNDFGWSTSNNARAATNYYFLRNDDNLAQTKMGAMRLWHNYRYDHTTTTGNITIDKNNGQTQYIAVTGNITGITLSNFVTTASDGTNTDQEMDTVTLWLRQDATGRTITMPTGANYFYANGTTTVSTTANSVSKIEFTAIDNSGTQYLIDISQAYTST